MDIHTILTHHSPHLANGYLGLPEATADKFVNNPFSSDPADRMYRTGDLGRYMPDGIGICWCWIRLGLEHIVLVKGGIGTYIARVHVLLEDTSVSQQMNDGE